MHITSKETGIYMIFCSKNGFTYIGSASGKHGISGRLNQHLSLLRRNKHHSSVMQSHFDKYGEAAFDFIILEICASEDRFNAEQRWLDRNGVGYANKSYNLNAVAGAVPAKLIKKPDGKDKRLEKMRQWNKQNPLSQEELCRYDQIIGARNAKSYVVTTPDGQELGIRNLTEFCYRHDLCTTQMVNAAKGTVPHHKQWKCRYAHETKEQQEAKVSKILAERVKKEYIITSPDGQEFLVNQLRNFCREHGLAEASMSAVAHGKCRIYKGWLCRFVNEPERILQKRMVMKDGKRDYVVTLPSGEEIRIRGLIKFCRENGLNQPRMSLVVSGQITSYRGYKCRRVDDT